MCGIVGYVGPRETIPLLIAGLEKLEYRGYDSAGVAGIGEDKFEIYRSQGKLGHLKELLQERGRLPGSGNGAKPINVGLGHTRWATHGKPSEVNAHPHVAGRVCVVHNGIIENYLALKQRLQAEGCAFVSETDTEIAAHLINSHLGERGDLLSAVRAAVAELEGSYALVVMSLADPNCLVIARNATPIIIGLGQDENFIASDIPAILEHTRKVLVVDDGEIAKITADGVYFEKDGKEVIKEPTTITWDPITAEKGGFRHFMLKEIHEQPQVVTDTFRGRINQEVGDVFLDDVHFSAQELKDLTRVAIVGCGTAWHAALVAKFYIEKLAKIPVEVDYSSEFRYRSPLIDEQTLVVAISQSGETADTLGALRLGGQLGAKTMAICNVIGSSIARSSSNVLYTHAGPEISVASTKAFVTQLTAAYLLALHLAAVRGTLSKEERAAKLSDLVRLPALMSEALGANKQVEEIAKRYGRSENFIFLGRGMLYPIALEGALKLKEISYLHAEGYPAGEMKHGPIALIDENTPVVCVLGHDGINYDKVMSNLKEVESRGGRIIAVADHHVGPLTGVASEIVSVGEIPVDLLPIVLPLPLQLLAYHVAVFRGTDVDQPRNLAKSVTVE